MFIIQTSPYQDSAGFDGTGQKIYFLKDLIRHFTFVTIREAELDGNTDEQVIENIREGVKKIRLVE